MSRFLTEDDRDQNNVLLRKLLIKKIQIEPKDEWFKTLSWLYLIQKDYSKALVQEKARYKNKLSDLSGVIDVGKIAFDAESYQICKEAFTFVYQESIDKETKILCHYYLLESKKKLLNQNVDTFKKDLQELYQNYQTVFTELGRGIETISIQVSYAQFLTFYDSKPELAISVLEEALTNNLDRFQKSEIKIQLADILVYNSEFNQALVIYSQVQNDLKNHPLAQTARYKVAQTSYFKGDFEWANVQLKVLKQGTSKLIANDAIDLSLLISDNIAQDSIDKPLKLYAKADLLSYQNKINEAIDTLNTILTQYKGSPIEDEALFKQAKLYEKTNKYQEAIKNYELIIQLDPDDILVDDAMYQLAIIYDEKYFDEEKAKYYFEKILLNQPSSIYLVPARKRYRELRGDDTLP